MISIYYRLSRVRKSSQHSKYKQPAGKFDIISGSYVNHSSQKNIHSFFPNVIPGYKIVESPINLVYLPITLDTIHSMETSIRLLHIKMAINLISVVKR